MCETCGRLSTRIRKHPEVSGWLIAAGWVVFFARAHLSELVPFVFVLWPVPFVLWGMACILSCVALIFRSQAQDKKVVREAIIRIALSCLSIAYVFAFIPVARMSKRASRDTILCQDQMRSMYCELQSIVKEHQTVFPEKWNDALTEEAAISNEVFFCRGSGRQMGLSDFAINENVVGKRLSEISQDIVVLFESEPGWNVRGGPAQASFSNHRLGFVRICNVILADGSTAAVSRNEINTLQWKCE